MQLWSVNYKPPLNWTNTGNYQCIEHFGNQKTCIESKIGWFLKESFSYPGPFNDFDWEIFWSLKYIHAQKKNCKHTAMCLLSFADNKTFKSLHLTQKNTELQFNTDFEFSELFLCVMITQALDLLQSDSKTVGQLYNLIKEFRSMSGV